MEKITPKLKRSIWLVIWFNLLKDTVFKGVQWISTLATCSWSNRPLKMVEEADTVVLAGRHQVGKGADHWISLECFGFFQVDHFLSLSRCMLMRECDNVWWAGQRRKLRGCIALPDSLRFKVVIFCAVLLLVAYCGVLWVVIWYAVLGVNVVGEDLFFFIFCLGLQMLNITLLEPSMKQSLPIVGQTMKILCKQLKKRERERERERKRRGDGVERPTLKSVFIKFARLTRNVQPCSR